MEFLSRILIYSVKQMKTFSQYYKIVWYVMFNSETHLFYEKLKTLSSWCYID